MKFAVVAVKFTQAEKSELLRALKSHIESCNLSAVQTESIPALSRLHERREQIAKSLAAKIEKVEPYM